MSTRTEIDGVLVEWGERLFYPRNRIVRSTSAPRLSDSIGQRATAIRRRIQAIVVRRAPQVMVKVTGGGRGMAAIATHFRYISKSGRLPFEDDRGITREGKEALQDLAEQWRHGGSFIDETSHRREAFNIMLSMPSGTDPVIVQRAAREFAHAELRDHRYVMVLHDHQANPHVHLSVRAESRHGKRLNPRKADLQRWRDTFAEKLRGWGIDAEATRLRTRGEARKYEAIWRVKARAEGRLRLSTRATKSGPVPNRDRADAAEAWNQIAEALSRSDVSEDRGLALDIRRFLSGPFAGDPVRRSLVKPREQPSIPTIGQTLTPVARKPDGPYMHR
jgi:hypothetical protein